MTGVGPGIGRSVAVGPAGAGRPVVAAGRRPDGGQPTASLTDGDVRCVPTDVTSPTDVTMLFDRVVADFDRVDPLFNNAGAFGPPGAPFPELSYEDWRGSSTPIRTARYAVPGRPPYSGRG
ncbi:SDR family oxidoreductase [Streptomyces qinzhouensis]|uniref:SDR family oxidoreductase n=1 Tax=Streptomyces qinzhouensis TaxID=2599401 RepID=UPI00164433F3